MICPNPSFQWGYCIRIAIRVNVQDCDAVVMGVGPHVNPAFRIVQAVVIRTILFRRRIRIRQWFVLSKWTKKYKQYKQLQKKIDEKVDYDNDNNEGNEGQRQ
jgi:hypothetical protein